VTLQTYQEEEILRKIRHIDHKIGVLETLIEEILHVVQPHYKPTAAIVVIPARFDK